MRGKILTILMSGVLCISMVACTKSSNQTKKNDEVGVEFKHPDKWKSKQKNLDGYIEVPKENITSNMVISFIPYETMDKAKQLDKEADKIPETDKAKLEEASKEIMDLTKEFKEICNIVLIDKSKSEGEIQKSLFSKFENKDLLGKEENLEWYLLYNDKPDTNGLSEKSKKDYEECFGEIAKFKSTIKTFKPISDKEKFEKIKKLEFKTKTLEGEEIDSSILKDNKLTMVNIWGTYCSPCIGEMPDIQNLYEEFKGEKVDVIGIVIDTPDKENEELAKKILSKQGVEFTNIIPNEGLKNTVLKDVSAVPMTFFVDSQGNIIGDFIQGTRDKEEYKKEIQDRLKNIE
ncbi:TlpA disulfide reductase family protein [Clostridium gasigenes]|uniref:TlpA family protein disulfide reductase n=1 Tax=Clostridium gasigenes TaxID=94869 RepID=A0A7X0S901_9CLOT|nr:TlpA disulfide reductase family protein [Clostridium gasigenes]MBB6713271.1 TlpA family protein disulfide reductase [Clostridium gasigenes]